MCKNLCNDNISMQNKRRAVLVLQDGTRYEGWSFGYEAPVAGEVVFYTAMTGYVESLTDPSYKGQILVPTYPLIGNYGVPSAERDQWGIEKFYESDRIHCSALVVSYYSGEYSHWNAVKSLGEWLREQHVPAIYGVGVKYNILRCLLRRGATVIRVPWDYDFSQEDYDGLFLSNGPGDPSQCGETIAHIAAALQDDRPIMGICLGNQLLARAAGASTYKLKYGHRGHNQPVMVPGTNRCFITSQNHGFAIDDRTLPEDWETLFVNVNDGTNEGIRHRSKPFFSTQYHPEASSGPVDTEYLFDEFIENIKAWKAAKH